MVNWIIALSIIGLFIGIIMFAFGCMCYLGGKADEQQTKLYLKEIEKRQNKIYDKEIKK